MSGIIGHRGLLMQAASGTPTDPYWANVVYLLNMGGADGSTSFPDSTGSRIWTPSGNVQVDTSLGYNAALFDGSGDHITAPYVQADMDWWTGDYTIEAWIRVGTLADWHYTTGANNISAMIGCASVSADINYWSFGPISGGVIRFYYYNGAAITSATSTGTVSTGTLAHIAMSKTASGIYLAVNGTVESPIAVSGTPLSSSSGVSMTLGQINNRSINGWVKAIRGTKGVARYTANFTPPAAPFPDS